jgi:hypothetical protein
MVKAWLDWLAAKWWVSIVPLCVLTFFVWMVLVGLDVGVRSDTLPWGVVSLEIPDSADHAWESITAWTFGQQQTALTSVRVDFLFILCYGLLLFRWGWWLKRQALRSASGKLAMWMSGCVNVMFTLVGIAMLCDMFENFNLIAMINQADLREVKRAAGEGYLVHTAFFRAYLITKSCAIIKFVCLGVFLLLALSASAWIKGMPPRKHNGDPQARKVLQ